MVSWSPLAALPTSWLEEFVILARSKGIRSIGGGETFMQPHMNMATRAMERRRTAPQKTRYTLNRGKMGTE